MKRGFTLIELIFVIVIIGILSAVLIPRFNRPTLTEAAHQLVSHIRYTQHLAMVDNKFNPNDAKWFKGRWQIRFKEDVLYNSITYPKVWAYSIYSDKKTYTNNPDKNEMAKNPLNNLQYLSGGYNNTLSVNDELSMKEMRLGEKYGIKDIKFSNGCRGGVYHIQFDNIGRPFNGYSTTSNNPTNNPYGIVSNTHPQLITRRCEIALCIVNDCGVATKEEKITIAVERETGYTHIL